MQTASIRVGDLFNQSCHSDLTITGSQTFIFDNCSPKLCMQLESILQCIAEHEELEAGGGVLVPLNLEFFDFRVAFRCKYIGRQTLIRAVRCHRGGDGLEVFRLLFLRRLQGSCLIGDELLGLRWLQR